jgi:hypothetical protein
LRAEADGRKPEHGEQVVDDGPGVDGASPGYAAPASGVPEAPASSGLLFGGEGDDFLDAADAAGAADTVSCGPGNDLAEADAEDSVAGDREEVRRS